MKPIIRVENLSKQYRIGAQQASYATLRDSISNAVTAPFRRLRNLTSFTDHRPPTTDHPETIWALKDINFEVQPGEVVGIIGRNGAGKSTLLKILSRITEPTTGKIDLHGRVSSLLEVGTGFHPELTGRENIYLNGAVLGMKRAEITRKFDEIVAFAEIEKFLDTPVKHYSSGMYMRLAFSVAAHLEPEILIVDEVLAVGDAEFQRKCLGKMSDVAVEGRTVLFVSHNMGAMQKLCGKCVLLERGQLVSFGATNEVINQYLVAAQKAEVSLCKRKGNGKAQFHNILLKNKKGEVASDFFIGESVFLSFDLTINQFIRSPIIAIEIKNLLGESYAHVINDDASFYINARTSGKIISLEVEMSHLLFTPSAYVVSLWIGEDYQEPCDELLDLVPFNLMQGGAMKRTLPYPIHVKTFVQSRWRVVNEGV